MPDDVVVQPEFVDARKAARIAAVTPFTIYMWSKTGVLPTYEFPGTRSVRFRVEDVRNVLKRREVKRDAQPASA